MARFCVVVTLAVCCLVTSSNGTDPGPASADWLNSTCSADSDCPAARNSKCFEGLCLCTPGYYYPMGQDTCVEKCAQSYLQETFLKYTDFGITSVYITVGYAETEEKCMEWCRNVMECRTVDYIFLYTACYLQSKTVLDVPVGAWVTKSSAYNHYQMMCA